MNFCKDCKFCRLVEQETYVSMSGLKFPPVKFYYCNNENLFYLDPVTGEQRKKKPDCYKIRDDENLCGKSGKWYEPKNGDDKQ